MISPPVKTVSKIPRSLLGQCNVTSHLDSTQSITVSLRWCPIMFTPLTVERLLAFRFAAQSCPHSSQNCRIMSSDTSVVCSIVRYHSLTLQNVFWPFVRKHYPDALPQDIAMMAASHFLSIVPLHQNRRHQARFLEACKNILSKQGSKLG